MTTLRARTLITRASAGAPMNAGEGGSGGFASSVDGRRGDEGYRRHGRRDLTRVAVPFHDRPARSQLVEAPYGQQRDDGDGDGTKLARAHQPGDNQADDDGTGAGRHGVGEDPPGGAGRQVPIGRLRGRGLLIAPAAVPAGRMIDSTVFVTAVPARCRLAAGSTPRNSPLPNPGRGRDQS